MTRKNKKQHPESEHRPFIRLLLLIAGSVSALLGFIGIFLPLLPTTPFLLLSSWCFVRSSDKMNSWLMHNRLMGPYISNYKSGKGITLRNKAYSLIFLYVTLSISFIYSPAYWWLRIGLGIIAIAVSIHILKFKTLKRES
ncbi:MAG: YbaN family protein [Lentimicrobium sp.]|nr:YbaN family protein [Lentimicrobium sp.]